MVGTAFSFLESSNVSGAEKDIHTCSEAAGELLEKAVPHLFEAMARKTSCTYVDPARSVFTGVTAVVDYTCHAHRDHNNMVGGATAVVSFAVEVGSSSSVKSYCFFVQQAGDAGPPQLHVLNQYSLERQVASIDPEKLLTFIFRRRIRTVRASASECRAGAFSSNRQGTRYTVLPA